MARSYVTVRRRRRTLLLRVGKEKMQKKGKLLCLHLNFFFLRYFNAGSVVTQNRKLNKQRRAPHNDTMRRGKGV